MSDIKTYSELISIPSFGDRVRYLQQHASVGADTFGPYRYLCQEFYRSAEWRDFKRDMVIRDKGCDLAFAGHELPNYIFAVLHHLNPLTVEDFINHTSRLLDPENVITTMHATHNIIHYSFYVPEDTFDERSPNDTSPWRVSK